MFGIHDLALFLTAGILLNLTPGPDTLYILGRSIAQGRGAGIASVLGISAGGLVHTVAAALGLSAILAASAAAFVVVKLAGAAYLVYLGVRMLTARPQSAAVPSKFSSSGFGVVFRQGLLTNVLNPKVALFFLAFMPQFIAVDSTAKVAAFLTLGACFITTGAIWGLALAWFASTLSARIRGGAGVGAGIRRTVGAVFVLLGVRLALTK
jgi:threonine/homoserine/homoserine lactone efflux protein